ncbi:hypothetical protein [Acinetobacter baumannii]|uniref:hypothetical protein n=1 Tax=Acinetobacter baumannii TaxID=470 RepID=UPI003F4C89CD
MGLYTNGSHSFQLGKAAFKTPLNVFRFQTDYPKVWNELTQEIDFQRRKQLAIKLRETNIPTYDRKAYKTKRGFTGSR